MLCMARIAFEVVSVDILLQNGVYHLSGRMDEFSEFDILTQAVGTLQLNIGKITSINSIGVRKLLGFIVAWDPRQIEFFEATPEFIGNVNIIPQLVGIKPTNKAIRTFYVPFYCTACKCTEVELWDHAKLQLSATGDVVVPAKVCGKCGENMELDAEPSEYFIFLKRG